MKSITPSGAKIWINDSWRVLPVTWSTCVADMPANEMLCQIIGVHTKRIRILGVHGFSFNASQHHLDKFEIFQPSVEIVPNMQGSPEECYSKHSFSSLYH